jgi:hypothetical protein
MSITWRKLYIIKGGSSSVVERQLPKLNVAGSIPVSRSTKLLKDLIFRASRPRTIPA